MNMKSLKYALIVAAAVGLAGCRQADGPMPAMNPNIQGELEDVRHDLQNIATNRDPAGPKDLADDLRKYSDKRAAHPAIDELSRKTATALPGKKVDEQTGNRLAHSLWTVVAGRELSDRQVEALQNDLQSILVSVGVAEGTAQQIGVQAGEVQKQVTSRDKRWYEWF
jgi:hypothetical protein